MYITFNLQSVDDVLLFSVPLSKKGWETLFYKKYISQSMSKSFP